MTEKPATSRCGSRLRAWDDRVLTVLAGGALAEERFMGKVLGLASHLAVGVICYPMYGLLLLLWRDGRALVAQVVAADLIGLTVLVGLRYATHRPRPPKRRDHVYTAPWNRYSFPSGHATRAFAVSVTLAYAGPDWCVLALAVASVIALSRITLARHYPSDVLAGMGIGSLAGAACAMSALQAAPIP